MNNDALNRMISLASDISIQEQESSDIYQIVKFRLCSTRENRNQQGVTEEFIDSVVSNQDEYNCLPLYVDLARLNAKAYGSLTHLHDRDTGTFGTTMVGSICSFEKVADEYGVSLMGEARIPKRNIDICNEVIELYNMGSLNFSYEIAYERGHTVERDGVMYVDASENNHLTGMCIVSVPAYPESTALKQIAEEEGGKAAEDPETEEKTDERNDKKMTLEEAMNVIAEKDQKIADLESKVSTAEKNVEDKNAEMTTTLAEKDQAISEKDQMIAEKDQAITEKEEKITSLETEIAEMKPLVEELNTIKAEQEKAAHEAKVEKAKIFAQNQGLDVEAEDIKNAIAELDYEKIAELSMAAKKPEKEIVSAGFVMTKSIKVEDQFGDLF